MTYTLKKIAELLNCSYQGNPDLIITMVCGLDTPQSGGLAYLTNQQNIQQVATPASLAQSIKAGLENFNLEMAIIVHPSVKSSEHNLIFSQDPLVCHVAATKLLYPTPLPEDGIHPTAILGKNVKLGEQVTIEPYVVIGDNVSIDNSSIVGAGTIIRENVAIGSNCFIHPRVTIMHGSCIGNRVVIHPHAVIGADGHGYFQREGRNFKLPQVGFVIIADDVEIGACTTIDRGRLQPTIIGEGCKLDNQIQIGHNVELGKNALISAQSAIGGSTKTGNNLILGGQSGIIDHVTLGDNITAIARTAVTSSTQSGKTLAGMPSRSLTEWRSIEACLSRLKELFSRVRKLEGALPQEERR